MSFKHEKFVTNNQPVTTVMYKACVFGFGVKTCSLNSKCGQFFKEGGELVFFFWYNLHVSKVYFH